MRDDQLSDVRVPESAQAGGPADGAGEQASALPEGELARLTDDIVAALKTVYDPEIPADIYELGLIYKVDIADDRAVVVDLSLIHISEPTRPY